MASEQGTRSVKAPLTRTTKVVNHTGGLGRPRRPGDSAGLVSSGPGLAKESGDSSCPNHRRRAPDCLRPRGSPTLDGVVSPLFKEGTAKRPACRGGPGSLQVEMRIVGCEVLLGVKCALESGTKKGATTWKVS